MRHTHKREIDGTVWAVNEFSATEGLGILSRLTKLCGGPISRALGSLSGGGILDATVDFSILGEALSDLCGRLDEAEVVSLVKRLLASTVVDGDPAGGSKFDLIFQGRYWTMFKVMAFVVEVNYKIPFPDLLNVGSAESQP